MGILLTFEDTNICMLFIQYVRCYMFLKITSTTINRPSLIL